MEFLRGFAGLTLAGVKTFTGLTLACIALMFALPGMAFTVTAALIYKLAEKVNP